MRQLSTLPHKPFDRQHEIARPFWPPTDLPECDRRWAGSCDPATFYKYLRRRRARGARTPRQRRWQPRPIFSAPADLKIRHIAGTVGIAWITQLPVCYCLISHNAYGLERNFSRSVPSDATVLPGFKTRVTNSTNAAGARPCDLTTISRSHVL